MTQLIILSTNEKKDFVNSPSFNKKERQLYFRLTPEARKMINSLRKPENRVGCFLQFGYFQASGKFYSKMKFQKRDINHVCQLLGIKNLEGFNRSEYASTSADSHQERILSLLEWRRFGEEENTLLFHRAKWLAANQRKPKDVFWALVDFCWNNQIVIPTYSELTDIVSQCYIDFETNTLAQLQESLSPIHLKILDDTASARYRKNHGASVSFSSLKKISQSLKVTDIKQSVKMARVFKDDFNSFQSVYDDLNLSDQATEYFATWVEKSTTHQFSQIPSDYKRHLYLLAFIKHHFYSRQDTLTDTFMKCVTSSMNKIREKVKEKEIEFHEDRAEAIKVLSETSKSTRQLLDEITIIVDGAYAMPSEKFYKIENIIREAEQYGSTESLQRLEEMERTLLAEINNDAYYSAVNDQSAALENRVSGIISVLEFDKPNTATDIFKAISYFKDNNGKLDDNIPLSFLSTKELNAITREDGVDHSQYKCLLFLHIFDGIKSGKVNLKYSYRYRAVNEYLINKDIWDRDKSILLKTAGMEKFRSPIQYLTKMKKKLEKQFVTINKNYQAGKNSHLTALENGHVTVKTPNIGHSTQEYIATTLSKGGIVPIQQVLAEVDGLCHYSEEFEHLNIKHHKREVKLETIIAGLIAKGCNIGLGKMSKISEGVKTSTLKNTVNWYFSVKNLQAANKQILAVINSLPLAKNYINNPSTIHSSSDGQKVNVAVDSLHAKRSYKYFGKSQGVDIYTFTDETDSLFHSTVISSADRDAPYVVDGLLNNDVKEERIHSTDEHGFNLAVHATTHFIDVSFAPRFKKLKNKTLHGFSTKSTYKKKGYDIYPSRRINQRLIIEQWDDILRFICSIKLGIASASQLFQRLNSYAKDHPLYKALKEFGGICKTQYILSYCEDVKLRQQVQKMLTRIELSNKFSKAVFFDHSGEFQEGTKEEQEIAISCKVLLQNSIILFNYLCLSEIILKTSDKEERIEIIESIKQGSVMSWRSVNLFGSYSFKNIAANDPRFDLQEIKAMSIN